MYTKTNWVARVGTALNRFLKTNETPTEVELTNDPTGVSVQGTPFTVANMNKIEQGIYDAHVGLDNNGLIDNTRINQDVRTTASPTFANATIGGHNVDSELDTLNSRVNQGVNTTSSPTFAGLTVDSNPIMRVDASEELNPNNSNLNISAMDIGQMRVVTGQILNIPASIKTPTATGTYLIIYNTRTDSANVKLLAQDTAIHAQSSYYSLFAVRIS